MNWIESIREIRRAQENNRLVIFVGSGVSANSGIPTWDGLVLEFAKEINYNERCSSCKDQSDECPKGNCDVRFSFTPDEYLRIPEYYFQRDSSPNHSDYYNLIQLTLQSSGVSNVINDEILRILPHHIITTNFDPLLENSNAVNTQLYTVVSQDSDLLSKANDRYIIKMHGDLTDPKTIVLKESDYINYEQEHMLISTFIKSLLVNHTFLFVGYSLNDYNLNLIIGWINYFCNVHGISERPKNYLIQGKTPSEFEVARLESRNIFIVDLNTLPAEIELKTEVPPSLENKVGRWLFAYLKCITDSQALQNCIPLSEILNEKYKTLEDYVKISYEDIIRVHRLGRTEFKGNVLLFYEQDWYEKVVPLLTEENLLILNTFQRAGITTIHCFNTNQEKEIPLLQENKRLFQLYLDNNYSALFENLQISSSVSEKIYYCCLFNRNDNEIEGLLSEEATIMPKGKFIILLLHKMRNRLATLSAFNRQDEKTKELNMLLKTAPAYYKDAIGYAEKLFKSDAENYAEMETLLNKQEVKYKYGTNTIYFEHSYDKIWSLQAYAYDYYYFFKMNCLPFDNYSDPKTYFSYYLKAILCSYSPVAIYSTGNFLDNKTDRRHYPLEEIDIDMLVKYTHSNDLKQWIHKYSVQRLELVAEIDITGKFMNFCKSYVSFYNHAMADQMYCFVIIICLLHLDEDSKRKVFLAMVDMNEALAVNAPTMLLEVFESIEWIVEHLSIEGGVNEKDKMSKVILKPSIYPMIKERYQYKVEKILKQLAQYVSEETIDDLEAQINGLDNEPAKCRKIFELRKIIPIKKYGEYLSKSIKNLNYDEIFDLTVEKILPFDDISMNRLAEEIDTEVKKRRTVPGLRSYPDHLSGSINCCLILKLLGYAVSLPRLAPYVEYSEHLAFMLNPDEFDYTKVDTSNYLWENLIYSAEYREFFLKHKRDILSDSLETVFARRVATTTQQKIVYGILLDDNELQTYGKQLHGIGN